MKKIYLMLLFSIFSFGNAQVSKIFEFTDSKLIPMHVDKQRMKIWKDKVFYQGTGPTASFPIYSAPAI